MGKGIAKLWDDIFFYFIVVLRNRKCVFLDIHCDKPLLFIIVPVLRHSFIINYDKRVINVFYVDIYVFSIDNLFELYILCIIHITMSITSKYIWDFFYLLFIGKNVLNIFSGIVYCDVSLCSKFVFFNVYIFHFLFTLYMFDVSTTTLLYSKIVRKTSTPYGN